MSEAKMITYYGVPVYYRIEQRRDGNVFIFSYRRELNGRLRVDYEHPPRRIPKLEKLLHNAKSSDVRIDSEGKTLLEQLPNDVMDEFFSKFLDISDDKTRAIGLERRKSVPELTLGALIAADRTRLIPEESEITGNIRSAASLEDDARTLRCLCQHEGYTRWFEITVPHCASWLSKESVHMKKSCCRMMKRLLLPFFDMRTIDGLLGWEHYNPQDGSRHSPKYKSLVRNNIPPNMLTYQQCRELLEKTISLSDSIRVSGVDMALVLKLTLGLDTEEICALKLGSFRYLEDFPERLAVSITHQFRKSPEGRNYRIHDIDDLYQRRMLPLSRLAAQCYEKLCAQRKKHTADTPLVPSKANSNRYMTPVDLDRELENRVSTLFSGRNIGDTGFQVPAAKKLLDTTAEQELRKSGCEEEELRFIQGKRPLLVSAVSYSDFLNEAELNKLGAMQDRWLTKVVPMDPSRETANTLDKRGAVLSWGTPYRESRTHAMFEITFQACDPEKIPDDGITLELHALHGFSGTILWNANESLFAEP